MEDAPCKPLYKSLLYYIVAFAIPFARTIVTVSQRKIQLHQRLPSDLRNSIKNQLNFPYNTSGRIITNANETIVDAHQQYPHYSYVPRHRLCARHLADSKQLIGFCIINICETWAHRKSSEILSHSTTHQLNGNKHSGANYQLQHACMHA